MNELVVEEIHKRNQNWHISIKVIKKLKSHLFLVNKLSRTSVERRGVSYEEKVSPDLLRFLKNALSHEEVPRVVGIDRLGRNLFLKVDQLVGGNVRLVAELDVVASGDQFRRRHPVWNKRLKDHMEIIPLLKITLSKPMKLIEKISGWSLRRTTYGLFILWRQNCRGPLEVLGDERTDRGEVI